MSKNYHRRFLGTMIVATALLAATSLTLTRVSAKGPSIGINVLLNTPLTDTVLTDLGRYGTVRDTLPEVNAVILNAEADELSAIQSLPYVKAANPDRPRFPGQAGQSGGTLP